MTPDSRTGETEPPGSLRSPHIHKTALIFLFLFSTALFFSTVGLISVGRFANPTELDTPFYLKEAIFIREQGGILNFLYLNLTGQYRQANQHPLYLMILSVVTSREFEFYPRAKILTLIIGLAAVLVTFLVAKKNFGGSVAILAIFFLALNQRFVRMSSMVAVEPLLALFILLSWHFIVKGFEREKVWGIAGIFSGLAYLSKGSGFFMAIAFTVSCLWIYGLNCFKKKSFWAYFLAHSATSAPLLVRNLIAFGNPLFNVNNLLLWGNPVDIIFYPQLWKNSPGMIAYFQDHALKEIAQRIFTGLLGQGRLLLESLSYFSQIPIYLVIGACFLTLSGFGLILDQNKKRKIFTAITFLFFFIFFSWYYAATAAQRFLVPLVPLILIYSSLGIKHFLVLLSKYPKSILSAMPGVLAALLLILSVFLLLTHLDINSLHRIDFPEGYLDLYYWLQNNVGKGETYLLGPSLTYNFDWHSRIKGRHLYFPYSDDQEHFRSYLRDNEVDYLVIDEEIYSKKELLKKYIGRVEGEGLKAVGELEGWELVYKDTTGPVNYLIFRIRREFRLVYKDEKLETDQRKQF
ncbi:ArnT family glycosyltransferase [Candidatus Hakubella thermalkaliphila]|uniref:ArnT family glycosyltransferase n=1 Tax=Candidatus Hakubella thermalkaliphila TaxID=2754717 RepID=UPI0015945E53|nr:glycosyltransferase family 39 protein [Candidatus Hakubella thermalkaliphila]